MKPGNQKRIFACIAVLFSFLLASISVAQNPKPAVASPVASPTANFSPAPKHTATNNPAASPTQTSAPSSSSKLGASQTTNSSQSKTPTWNFWEATAGNWVAILGVLLAATIAGLIAIYAPRALERYKLRLQAEHKKKEEEQQATAKGAAQAKGVKAYREKLKDELSHLSISDLPNVPSYLNLESYVDLQVREEETLRYAKDEEMVALAAEEPSEQLRRSQVHIAKLAEVALAPEDALVKFRRMVVLGDPGAGKTTMERYLALQMVKQTEPKLPYLPVYVELKKFVESKKNDLLDFIADEWEKRYRFPNAHSNLEQQLDDGKVALLLDGLDEVLGGGTQEEAQAAYKRVADEINRVATLFSAAPIAVTCRKAGWRRGLKRFQTLEVLDFSWEQIQEFVKLRFKSNPDKAEGLRQALEKNLRMQRLAANPLILSLIAIVYQEDLELPERRAELYKRCLKVLLEEWDSHRDIKRFSQFSTGGKRNLLKEVAWHFHKSGKRYFPEDELLELIADFLPTISIQPEDNKAILDEIAAQYGLLKVQAHGWYGFVHLTFQEYFAALAVKDKVAAALSEVIVHRHEPWWEEVILLLSEMLNDATPLLLGILGHSTGLPELPEGNLAANDDRFHSDLLLAARCLTGTPRIRMNGLRDRISADVKNLLVTSSYHLDWERIARVLVEIGGKSLYDELLAMLKDNGVELGKQINSVVAFRKFGDQSVAGRFLELLDTKAELHGQVFGKILYALSERRAIHALPKLLAMFKAETNQWIQLELATTLIELGEKSVVPELIDMLTNAKCLEQHKIFLLNLVGSKGDKSVAPQLLQMLLAETTNTEIKPAIAQALRDLKDTSLVSDLLASLTDETIDWQIRWLLTEALEGLHEIAREPLRAMLENQNIDLRVRVGIAATLGTWGVRESIPYLGEAIESKVVPPNWCLRNTNWVGYIWQRITRTLKSLGDNSVVPMLLKALEQIRATENEEDLSDPWFIRDEVNRSFIRTRQYRTSLYEAMGIIYAASEYEPSRIAQQVLWMLRQPEWHSSQGELLRTLPKLATKSLVPELVCLLEERRMYRTFAVKGLSVVNAIGEVADDCKTVRALLKIGSSLNSEEEEYLAEPIYSALYSVSRRAGVRVSADGQIEELKN
ncbi:NACHT domain-containing protein [Cyanobacteria bacterium FACHB-472]|nr:NACHT domain-containing protein [Cyanobacteria bacterium FACHB-472]